MNPCFPPGVSVQVCCTFGRHKHGKGTNAKKLHLAFWVHGRLGGRGRGADSILPPGNLRKVGPDLLSFLLPVAVKCSLSVKLPLLTAILPKPGVRMESLLPQPPVVTLELVVKVLLNFWMFVPLCRFLQRTQTPSAHTSAVPISLLVS